MAKILTAADRSTAMLAYTKKQVVSKFNGWFKMRKIK